MLSGLARKITYRHHVQKTMEAALMSALIVAMGIMSAFALVDKHLMPIIGNGK